MVFNVINKFMFFFFNDTATTEIYTYLHTLSLHAALPIWGQDAQRLHVLAEQLRLARGQLCPVGVDLGGPLEQGVVDVGDILHVMHLVPGVAPRPVEQVEADVRGRMSHVGGVVGRDATDIEARRARGTRWGEGAGGGVEDRDLRPRDGKERHLRCGPRLHGAQPSQLYRTSVDRPQKPDLTRLLSERWPRDGRPVPGRRRHHAFVEQGVAPGPEGNELVGGDQVGEPAGQVLVIAYPCDFLAPLGIQLLAHPPPQHRPHSVLSLVYRKSVVSGRSWS